MTSYCPCFFWTCPPHPCCYNLRSIFNERFLFISSSTESRPWLHNINSTPAGPSGERMNNEPSANNERISIGRCVFVSTPSEQTVITITEQVSTRGGLKAFQNVPGQACFRRLLNGTNLGNRSSKPSNYLRAWSDEYTGRLFSYPRDRALVSWTSALKAARLPLWTDRLPVPTSQPHLHLLIHPFALVENPTSVLSGISFNLESINKR